MYAPEQPRDPGRDAVHPRASPGSDRPARPEAGGVPAVHRQHGRMHRRIVSAAVLAMMSLSLPGMKAGAAGPVLAPDPLRPVTAPTDRVWRARWIAPPATSLTDHGVFLFRREFSLPARAERAPVTVTVDGRYQLFVNGTRVGRGPARCDPHHLRTDTYDIAAHLQPGRNVLGVLVHVYGVDTSWYQTVRGHWQPVFGDGGLYCDARIDCGAVTIAVRSDEQWRCCECPAWDTRAPRPMWSIGFIEVHDARQMPQGWDLPGFDDSTWDAVIPNANFEALTAINGISFLL